MSTYSLVFWVEVPFVLSEEILKKALPIFPDVTIAALLKKINEKPSDICFSEMDRKSFSQSFSEIKSALPTPRHIDTRCDWARFKDSIRMLEVIEEIEKNPNMKVFGCFINEDEPVIMGTLDNLPTKFYGAEEGGFAVVYDSI